MTAVKETVIVTQCPKCDWVGFPDQVVGWNDALGRWAEEYTCPECGVSMKFLEVVDGQRVDKWGVVKSMAARMYDLPSSMVSENVSELAFELSVAAREKAEEFYRLWEKGKRWVLTANDSSGDGFPPPFRWAFQVIGESRLVSVPWDHSSLSLFFDDDNPKTFLKRLVDFLQAIPSVLFDIDEYNRLLKRLKKLTLPPVRYSLAKSYPVSKKDLEDRPFTLRLTSEGKEILVQYSGGGKVIVT